ncbi:bromodomain-containing protein 4 isoform X2 [Selaginella moellendorffii]|uniref:bromodomain-containing protein 4 isoform X2 n=1 Tax=Selaginella moellendorffii TaxID=88036 RepID=UPI000D1CC00B|nr:bromodomain-containing protein 4 isoform X2 [Selaginella moellendorffii]|eukprot:XP_002988209.2 bromodomain-containing protein 4 isoform X2 [Selaginella moellendorffii]
MAGMMLLAKKIGAIPVLSKGATAGALGISKRNLCGGGGGDGRYIPGMFVENQEGNQENQAWPPPTQEGFVMDTGAHPQAPPPPHPPPTHAGFVQSMSHSHSSNGFVPVVTQGGFTDYSSPYQQQGYYPPPPPPPPPPQVPYPWNAQAQHQLHHHQQYPPPPGSAHPQHYNVEPQGYYHVQQYNVEPQVLYNAAPVHQHYVPPPDYGYTYSQQSVPAPPAPAPAPAYGGQDVNAAATWSDTSAVPTTTASQAVLVESHETSERVEVGGLEMSAAAELHVEQQKQHEMEPEVVAVPPESQQVAPPPAEMHEEVHEEVAKAEASEAFAEDKGGEVEMVAAVQEPEVQAEETGTVAEHEAEGESAAEESQEYDAAAMAMAEAGLPSGGGVEENEEATEGSSRDESEAVVETVEHVEEPVKGLESLLEVETSKAPAPPPASQNESFLEILSKTNTNVNARQVPRQRPPQLSFRAQRKTYAKLHNLPRQILKNDIVNYFSELNLQKDSVHMTYDEKFYPLYAHIAFDSTEALKNAVKILQTKGRLGGRIVKMESFVQFMPPTHPQMTEHLNKYLGRMLLMLHIPPEGRIEDLERFFDGYGFDPSALSMLDAVQMTLARFPKEGNRMVRRAAIGFCSSLEAMRALREKQGDFVLNEPIELRLIQ